MTLFFKKLSKSYRKINDEKHCHEEIYNHQSRGDDDCYYNINESGKNLTTCLTVWKKSLLMNCTGFTVIDCNGNLVYRVDNYCVRPGEMVLMDASGTSILTMRRQKTLRLVDDWLVYKGDVCDKYPNSTFQKQHPFCYVKKNVSILQANSNVLAHVFLGTSTKDPTYVIEGSYGQRSCRIYDNSSKKIVSEIKRKEAKNGCSFGLEVFQLIVWPGFDSGFAMTLVLLLDQMFG